jgi:hypothetical protein
LDAKNARRLKVYISLKAIIWYTIGLIFGAGMFLLSYFAHALSGSKIALNSILSYNDSMLICVCLMAGAAADVVCSPRGDWNKRIVPLLVGVIFLLFLGFIYRPEAPEPENHELTEWLAIAYFIISFSFCVRLKYKLFYEESSLLTKAKF